MKDYHVVWQSTYVAASPEEAARMALGDIQSGLCMFFGVTGPDHETHCIVLEEEE